MERGGDFGLDLELKEIARDFRGRLRGAACHSPSQGSKQTSSFVLLVTSR